MPQDRPAPLADWEAFYANYRKPGYVAGYEITSKLGGGMFGLVFKATKQSIGKDYAIKFLKVDDGEVRRAVLAELEQVQHFAQVDHPNLVSIEDRGEVDGIPYLVMAYAGSETLRDLLPGDAGSRPELLRLFLQACRGVAALHEKSLVHFDLKPANVFLKGGVARVGDYGLSKLVTHSQRSLSMGRGTPYYMAPEMLQRRGDHRSDIYSLGVLLFEVLTGDVPFKGDSEWEVLRLHETGVVNFPDHVGARERAIVLRCMHKDPDQRYRSVHDLMAAFGAPVGVGAAAFQDAHHDTRHDTQGANTPPPPKEAPAEDPYAGLRKASREAYTHASKIARDAMRSAQKITQKATAEARQAMQAMMQRTHKKNARRAKAWVRLYAMKRSRRKREREEVRARRMAKVRPFARGAVMLGVVALVVLAFLALMPARLGSSGYVYELADQPAVAAGQVPRPEAAPRLAILSVPPHFAGVVATKDPGWVSLWRNDRHRATKELNQDLARFRAHVPLSKGVPVPVELPKFGPLQSDLDSRQLDTVMRQLNQLQVGPQWDEKLAYRLRNYGFEALHLAAEALGTSVMTTDEGQCAAERLNRFLSEATGFETLQLPDARKTPPHLLALAAQHQRDLWFWFLHEFCNSRASWEVYRELRGL